jgi:hypothetical protein
MCVSHLSQLPGKHHHFMSVEINQHISIPAADTFSIAPAYGFAWTGFVRFIGQTVTFINVVTHHAALRLFNRKITDRLKIPWFQNFHH